MESRNCLHIVCGMPCSGKTTFAQNLAKELRATLLDIDICTERLVQTGLRLSNNDPSDRDSAYFKSSYREPIYDTLFEIAEENLKHIDTIIVGPFTKEIQDIAWPERIRCRINANVNVYYIWCDDITRKNRMITRGNPRDTAKLNNWDVHCQYYATVARPACEHDFVNTS